MPVHNAFNRYSVVIGARKANKQIEDLGEPIQVVFVSPRSSRHTRASAMFLLQDVLNLPDSATMKARNDGVIDSLLKGLDMPKDR